MQEITVKKVGEGVAITGMAGLFLMAVTGAVLCDLMILFAILNAGERRTRNENNNNQFVIGFLVGTMTARQRPIHHDAGYMLAVSPILSAIAIGLLFKYRHPSIAFALIYGWSASAGTLLLGLSIYALGDYLEKKQNPIVGVEIRDTDIRAMMKNNMFSYPQEPQDNTGNGLALAHIV